MVYIEHILNVLFFWIYVRTLGLFQVVFKHFATEMKDIKLRQNSERFNKKDLGENIWSWVSFVNDLQNSR